MAKLEFYYDYASPYAYFANQRLATVDHVEIDYKPIYIRGLDAFSQGIPFSAPKSRYIIADVRRIAAKQNLPLQYPSDFPINGLYALRAAIVAKGSDQFHELNSKLFAATWEENRNIGDKDLVLDVVETCGLDREHFAEAMNQQAIKDRLKADTQGFDERGGFGLPGFFVGDELFWGHDRLDMALEAAGTLE